MYQGYLSAEPEMRYLPNGKEVTTIRMGSNRSYKRADGTPVKEVTWLKVTFWGGLANIVNEYCKKGSQVIVTGRLKPGENGSPTVFNLKDGTPASSYEITGEDIIFLDKKPEGGESKPQSGDAPDDFNFDDSEAPF